ncbi:hypothetical protein GQ457_15G001960 [Hibiscus cannabinus]
MERKIVWLKGKFEGRGGDGRWSRKQGEKSEKAAQIKGFGFGFGDFGERKKDFEKSWRKLSHLNKEGKFSNGLDLLSFLYWHIWKSRNLLVFEAESDSPFDVWNRASAAFDEFTSISSSNSKQKDACSSSSHPIPSNGSWSAPPHGFFKVNCDGAFDPHSCRAAAACVVRDCSKEIIKGSTFSFFSRSAFIAEAIVVRQGVFMAINEGWAQVSFEYDNKVIISRINSIIPDAWESAAVEKYIISLVALFPLFSFCYAKPDCNKVTDWIVKTYFKGVCPLN